MKLLKIIGFGALVGILWIWQVSQRPKKVIGQEHIKF